MRSRNSSLNETISARFPENRFDSTSRFGSPRWANFNPYAGLTSVAAICGLNLCGRPNLIDFCATGEKPELRRGFCLLYTSDAADERSSVDLGGRRIIKKKK